MRPPRGDTRLGEKRDPAIRYDRPGTGGPYFGTTLYLVSKHLKERALELPVREGLGAELRVFSELDTDRLGTFTGEVPRVGTQLDAARAKAQAAFVLPQCTAALGSEGTFATGPLGVVYNRELVVLVDRARGLEILGWSAVPSRHVKAHVRDALSLESVAFAAGFPSHGLVVRPERDHEGGVHKGLTTWAELERALEEALRASSTGRALVESDLRAHMHPTRMKNIEAAGRDLVRRAVTSCPSCEAPGFGPMEIVLGLPCRECGHPTTATAGARWGCVACDRRELRAYEQEARADPGLCPRCNP